MLFYFKFNDHFIQTNKNAVSSIIKIFLTSYSLFPKVFIDCVFN